LDINASFVLPIIGIRPDTMPKPPPREPAIWFMEGLTPNKLSLGFVHVRRNAPKKEKPPRDGRL
jgi:hypothetical protein